MLMRGQLVHQRILSTTSLTHRGTAQPHLPHVTERCRALAPYSNYKSSQQGLRHVARGSGVYSRRCWQVCCGKCGPVIRPAQSGDVQKVAQLLKACQADWSQENIQAQLCEDHSVILVTALADAVIGCAVSWVLQDEAQILDLVVGIKHRRQGHALKLLHEVTKTAVARGARHAILEVRSNNIAAISLYECAGFQQVYVRKGYYHDGEDALLFKKQLMP